MIIEYLFKAHINTEISIKKNIFLLFFMARKFIRFFLNLFF
jgi:hypothetical protein